MSIADSGSIVSILSEEIEVNAELAGLIEDWQTPERYGNTGNEKHSPS